MGTKHQVLTTRRQRSDKRYTIALEYCGYPTARHVVRFCGQWLGQIITRREAIEITREHADTRRILMSAQSTKL